MARARHLRRRLPIREGDRFGRMTAIAFVRVDAGGNVVWTFECECGARVTWRVSTVASNARRGFGGGSCPTCYRAAVAARAQSPKSSTTPIEGHVAPKEQ